MIKDELARFEKWVGTGALVLLLTGMGTVPVLGQDVVVEQDPYASEQGFLGVELTRATPQLLGKLGVPGEQGALVGRVVEDSAAAAAGLEAGDIIVSIDGQSVDSTGTLRRAIRDRAAGELVAIEFFRDGRLEQSTATLGASRRHAWHHGDQDWSDWGDRMETFGKFWEEFGERMGEMGERLGEAFGDHDWDEIGERIEDSMDEADWEELERRIEDAVESVDWDEIGERIEAAMESVDWEAHAEQVDGTMASVDWEELSERIEAAVERAMEAVRDLEVEMESEARE